MRIRLDHPLSIKEIRDVTNATVHGNLDINTCINHICTDTRECKVGDLFIALQGEKDNGDKYVTEAIKKRCYPISSTAMSYGLSVYSSADALLTIAKYYKAKTRIKYTVAVTGSVGKSTTVKFLSIILNQRYNVHSPQGNFNNHIGVPLTVLSAPRDTEILIAELGMNHYSEISLLSKCVLPDIGIITAIGTSHIGNLGSREGIARAKLEILDGINRGVVLLPYSEPLLKDIKNGLYVATNSPQSDFSLNERGSNHYEFTSIYDSFSYNEPIDLPRHLLIDLAFAISVAKLLHLTDNEIISGIKMITKSDLRQRFIHLSDYTIFDDSYNASLESIKADLEYLSIYNGPKGAFLGDVLELGENSISIHENIGRAVASCGINHLYLYGEFATATARGAIDAGMNHDNVFLNTDISNPNISVEHIKKHHSPKEIILFKASHKLRLDKIADIIKKEERTNNAR